MASKIQYDVIANMAARGSFRGLRGMYTAMKPVFAGLGSIQKQVTELGAAIRGNVAQSAMGWGKMGAVVAAGPATAMGVAVKHGLAFNKTMENSTLQAATMYQLFDMGAKAAEVASGEMSQWKYNLQASKAVFKELYDIAEATPGSFKDVSDMYKSAAAGMSGATENLGEHLAFMRKAALLGGLTPDGSGNADYNVAGSQFGRILGGSAGAELVIWQNLKNEILKAGQAAKIFKKDQSAQSADFTEKFNKLDGSDRFKLTMKAMEKIGPDVAAAWAESMDGVLGTTHSVIDRFKERLTKPLYEGLRKGLMGSNKDGALGKANLDRWNNFADQAGQKLASAGMWVFHQAERAATFIRDNWVDIMGYAQNAGEVIAGAIKGAFAFGLARWIAGTAVLGLGKVGKAVNAGKDLAAKLRPVFEKQAKITHAAIVRGAHDKRGGILGSLGKFLGARTNRMEREGRTSHTFKDPYRRNKAGRFAGGKDGGGGLITRLSGRLGADPFRHIAKFLASAGSVAMVFAAGIPAVIAAVAAFGSLFVIVGGIGAYVVSNWKAISGSLIKGLQSGKTTLTPLLTAAYAFWARLKIVGQMFLGGSDHATQFNTVLGVMVGVIGAASTAVSFFLRSMAFFLGMWATMKLAMLGVARAILGIVELASYMPGGPGDDTVAQARQNYQAYNDSVWETMQAGSKLLDTADRLDNFKFGEMEMANIQKEADDMAASLKAMLEGKGKDLDNSKKPGAKVHIDKNYMNIDLRDEDPDRMMSMLFEPIARLAEHRVQSGALPAGGV